MKTIVSFFMMMIMALAVVSTGQAAGRSNRDVVIATAPAYTDFVDSREIPYKAGPNDLHTPDVMGW